MTDRIAACAAEIVALINASPRTPRVDEIAAIIAGAATPAFFTDSPLVAKPSPLLAKVQTSIARLKELYEKDDGDTDTSADDEALEALGAQCPKRPSGGDLAALALIARWFALSEDGPIARFCDDDMFSRSAVRLIDAVLRAEGLDPETSAGLPGGSPQPLIAPGVSTP
jgi:hypothetical protein